MDNTLTQNLRDFLLNTEQAKDTRYYAWVDCNRVFTERKACMETLAKELFMFLSNWGMLRNSFLLWHNWRILIPVAKLLVNDRFAVLQNAEVTALEQQIDRIITLKNALAQVLAVWCNNDTKRISGTLLSKITMGSLGCTVAYDRYVCKALAARNMCQTFNKTSLSELCTFYKDHPEFENVRQTITAKTGIDYPPMKLLDLAFWLSSSKEFQASVRV